MFFDAYKLLHVITRHHSNSRKPRTEHIEIDLSKCIGCLECIGVCTKRVLGQTPFSFHKHVVIINAADCSGCRKCIKSCTNAAITGRPAGNVK